MQQAPAAKAPSVPAPFVVTPDMMTARDYATLKERASELSSQLNSATRRRGDIHRQLERATGADKSGLEQRLSQLDGRIVGIEQDIAENGKQLASVPAARLSSTTPPADFTPRGDRFMNQTPVAIVFTIFVLAPLALTFSRAIWRRSSQQTSAAPNVDQQRRLERIEQAVDAIAIEVERVSEGQRFVTRLMAEGNQKMPAMVGGESVNVEQRRKV